MKFIILINFIIAIYLCIESLSVKEKGYTNVKKIYCSSSGISCTNPTCKVKPIDRDHSIFNMSCNLVKPLRNFMINIAMQHRNLLGGNFQPVFNLKNQAVCTWVKTANGANIGFMKNFIYSINMTFGGFVKECPYKRSLNVVNGSLSLDRDDVRTAIDSVQHFPNGYYKLTVTLHKTDDEKIFSFILFFENYYRFQHLSGYEQL